MLVDLFDEVAQHALGDVEIRNDAIFQRADRHDVGGSPTNHPLGVGPYGEHFLGLAVDRHDRGLIDDDAFAADEHEGVGRTEVDANVPRQEAKEAVQHLGPSGRNSIKWRLASCRCSREAAC